MRNAWTGTYENDEKFILPDNEVVSSYNANALPQEERKETELSKTHDQKPGCIEGDDCPICYAYGKSHAMLCGHIFCWDCVQKLKECPFCKRKKEAVFRVY